MIMRRLLFATNNPHKLHEIRQIAGNDIEILSLADVGFTGDIPETSDTIEGNAIEKAQYIALKTGLDTFADDTGMEVDALGGAPGVHTARFAALHNAAAQSHDAASNMDLLLELMQGKTNRRARFLTVIALVEAATGNCRVWTGECKGEIAPEPQGDNGFGYDPVFIPDASAPKTFAMLSDEEKNLISHRGIATRKFIDNLSDQSNTSKKA